MKNTIKSSEIGLIHELQVTYKPAKSGIKITDASQAYLYLSSIWDKKLITIQEQCYALFLDRNKEVIGYRLINTGSMTSASFDTKLLLSIALKCLADSIIIAHNHPAGSLEPSPGDIGIFSNVKYAAETMQITLADCLVINQDSYKSIMNSLENINYSALYNKDLTPGQLKLLDFFSKIYCRDRAVDLDLCFDLALFFCEREVSSEVRTALYFQKELSKIASEISNELEQ